jgi:hypothetical protein
LGPKQGFKLLDTQVNVAIFMYGNRSKNDDYACNTPFSTSRSFLISRVKAVGLPEMGLAAMVIIWPQSDHPAGNHHS